MRCLWPVSQLTKTVQKSHNRLRRMDRVVQTSDPVVNETYVLVTLSHLSLPESGAVC